MSAEELVQREAERRGPSEWAVALERYEGGYGEPMDYTDPVARVLFLQLLRDEVQRTLNAQLGEMFTRATAKFQAALAADTEQANAERLALLEDAGEVAR
jgi:hypothetical protein